MHNRNADHSPAFDLQAFDEDVTDALVTATGLGVAEDRDGGDTKTSGLPLKQRKICVPGVWIADF